MIEAIITDIRRMRAPIVCIAADHRGRTIRLSSPQPTEIHLERVGGLAPGDIVALDWRPGRLPAWPHSEDGDWRPSSLRKVGRMSSEALTQLLSDTALDSAAAAFGQPWFKGAQGNAAYRPGRGRRSLASILARGVRVYPHFEGVRVDFSDATSQWSMVPLEDLLVRQHQLGCAACKTALQTNLRDEYFCDEAILRIGLTRPFQTPEHPPACWLQVTGVYPLKRKRTHFLQRSSP